MDNPGAMLDDLGITCEELYLRMVRTGNHMGAQGMWDALQEYNTKIDLIERNLPDTFGAEA